MSTQMNEKQTGCKYEDCPHPIYKDRCCIFHLSKLTNSEKNKLSFDELSKYEELENKCGERFWSLGGVY